MGVAVTAGGVVGWILKQFVRAEMSPLEKRLAAIEGAQAAFGTKQDEMRREFSHDVAQRVTVMVPHIIRQVREDLDEDDRRRRRGRGDSWGRDC